MAGLIPESCSAASTVDTNWSSLNCRQVRLTETHIGGSPCCRQAMCCAHTVFSTQLPIGTMSPDSSAMGRKRRGGMIPKSGCDQRSRASAPVMVLDLRSNLGR